jgi:hypothetical protein
MLMIFMYLAMLNTSLLHKHAHKLFVGDSNSWADWVCCWYDGSLTDDDTPCWHVCKTPLYHSITLVEVGDGETSSFRHDRWMEVGVLRDVLPVLYSHCLDIDIMIAEVMAWRGGSTTTSSPGFRWP